MDSYNNSEEINLITYEIININSNIKKIILLENNERISYNRFIDLIINTSSNGFTDKNNVGDILLLHIIGILKDMPFNAYFFECIPISHNTKLSTLFEFVLINSNELSTKRYDDTVFKSHFHDWDHHSNGAKLISVFDNLGRDALLISPCPPPLIESSSSLIQLNRQDYTHLAAFIKRGDSRQIKLLFKESVYHLNQMLNSMPKSKILWLSTNGLGVSWLHIRIDEIPKYYTYEEYKIIK
jgi:hypothetical protein